MGVTILLLSTISILSVSIIFKYFTAKYRRVNYNYL